MTLPPTYNIPNVQILTIYSDLKTGLNNKSSVCMSLKENIKCNIFKSNIYVLTYFKNFYLIRNLKCVLTNTTQQACLKNDSTITQAYTKIRTSHKLKDQHEVRAIHSEHLHKAGSHVVDLRYCDGGMALHLLLYSQDMPSLETSFLRLHEMYLVPLYFSICSQHYTAIAWGNWATADFL